ncbi:MAG TPA: DUF1800 domain-containing protein [Terriglobia bacterium]|nr:DUF1800 domain-containing protein [Terriglobia bacterium]
MKRLSGVLCAISLILPSLALSQASPRFDVKLPPEKQITHVLSRLTFGARPEDVSDARRVGIERWIDLQLNPERIPESAILESRLAPLTTLNMQTWQIFEKYQQPQQVMIASPRVAPASVLSPLQMSKLMNGGTVEERREVIMSLNPDVRGQLILSMPPQALDGLPDLQQEATRARQAQQEALQAERRRLMPPINELLTPDQMRILRAGTEQEKIALLNSFDSDKRTKVLRAAGPQLQTVPALRREAMALAQPQQYVHSELIENKLYRAIYSNHQLEEVLVDFWLNHFNVFNGKAQGRMLLTSYERDAIRPYVFGRFKDMLLATARHPAMLIYLDNAQSQAPREDFPFGVPPNQPRGRGPGLNENYGRELMELHTLGVDGGYTQEDVVAVARAFTGWTVLQPNRYAEFQFNGDSHDRKEKVILEHKLPPGRGEQDGLDVIDILVKHPSTAKFISKKLAQRFVADDPPQTLIDRMAATFTRTQGDLRAVLQTLFSSTEFLSEAAWQSKLKSPLEVVVSAVRALNAETTDTFVLAQRIADLGQPLYGKVEPTGYPNTGEGWASTAGILGRINFATDLTAGRVAGVKADMSRFNFKLPAVVATEILGNPPSPSTVESIEKGIQGKEVSPSMLATVVLSSPEFQRR